MKSITGSRTRQAIALVAVAASAALALSACSSGGGTPSPSDSGGAVESFPLAVGTLPFASLAPFHIAEQEGLFEEAGLDVTTLEATSGAAQIAALMSGDIDVTYTNFVSAFQAVEKGLPIQIFLVNDLGNTGKALANGLMVTETSAIETPEDLAGKKIAINALGATQEMTTRRIMEDAGLANGDYELVEIPPANMIAALEAGQVDAAWMGEPFTTIGVTQNGLRQLSPAFYGRTAGVPQSGWVTTKQFAQEHPEQLAAFTNVMQGVLAESADDEQQTKVKDIIPTFTDISPEIAAQIGFIDFDGTNDLESIAKFEDEMVRYKILAEAVNVDDVILKQ